MEAVECRRGAFTEAWVVDLLSPRILNAISSHFINHFQPSISTPSFISLPFLFHSIKFKPCNNLASLPSAAAMAGFLSTLRRLYLSIYNWTVFYGWLQVLYLALKTLNESGHEKVYDAVEKPLQLAQTAAVMEIFHGLVGLVRSPVSATLPQISSRLFVTWGILWSFPETRTHLLVSSLVISWSITEIIRYSFFGMKEALGVAPSWLLWLRYSTFLVLYPTGITSEVGLIYTALPYIKGSDKYCIRMPNKWNFSFDYFYASILALGIYVPGSPHMYQYMLGQRKKALSKSKRE